MDWPFQISYTPSGFNISYQNVYRADVLKLNLSPAAISKTDVYEQLWRL